MSKQRGPEEAKKEYKKTHKSHRSGADCAHYFAHEELKAICWRGTDEEWATFDPDNKWVRAYVTLRDKFVDHKDNFRHVKTNYSNRSIHRIIDTDFNEVGAQDEADPEGWFRKKRADISHQMYEDRWTQKILALKKSGALDAVPAIYNHYRKVGEHYGFDLRRLNGSGPKPKSGGGGGGTPQQQQQQAGGGGANAPSKAGSAGQGRAGAAGGGGKRLAFVDDDDDDDDDGDNGDAALAAKLQQEEEAAAGIKVDRTPPDPVLS
eukprot:g5850.t1